MGIIAAFVTYTRQFFRPLNQLSNLLNTFQSAIAGAERVFEILDEPSEVADKPNAIKTASLKGMLFSNKYHLAMSQISLC